MKKSRHVKEHLLATVMVLTPLLGIGPINPNKSDEPPQPRGDRDPEFVYFDIRGLESTGMAWNVSGYKCVTQNPCLPGAVYVPSGGGQNISGCTGSGGACFGRCKYCSGGGSAQVCKSSVASETCTYESATLVSCGTVTEYTCVPSATPPLSPSGQPLSTENGCYCGTTPGTTSTTSCEFSRCGL